MESREVQRHVRAQLPVDPLRLRAQLRVGVVLAGDEERGDLLPALGLVPDVGERVEHGRKMRTGELHVELVGEALEVHVRRIHLRVELAPRLGRDVARGHRDGAHPRFAAGICGVHRVLGEDHRIVVGEGHARATRLHGGAGDGLGRSTVHEPVHVARLGDVPILTKFTSKIATGGAEGKHRAARQEVVERLLLDGIDAETRRAPVRGEDHRVVHARAHEAGAALALVQPALARAEVALDAAVLERVPPAAGVQRALDGIRHARRHRYFSTV